jgi:hypothetical protein
MELAQPKLAKSSYGLSPFWLHQKMDPQKQKQKNH